MNTEEQEEMLNTQAQTTCGVYFRQLRDKLEEACGMVIEGDGAVSLTLSMEFVRIGDSVSMAGKIKLNKSETQTEQLRKETINLNQRVLDLRTAEGKNNE